MLTQYQDPNLPYGCRQSDIDGPDPEPRDECEREPRMFADLPAVEQDELLAELLDGERTSELAALTAATISGHEWRRRVLRWAAEVAVACDEAAAQP